MRWRTSHVKAARLQQRCFLARKALMKEDVPAAAPGANVIPRAAASLLVVRQNDGVPQVLMGRRGSGHRFMPNVLVFPGGAVDKADFTATVGTGLRPEVMARLERSAHDGLAQALGVAAARELAEEVGLSLGEPPQLHGLDFFARAVTPPDRAMRFDAYFFAVDAALVRGTPRASHELEEPNWYGLSAALEANIADATRAILGQFRKWLVAPTHQGAVPVLRHRVWEEE
jgi:8-oxo-dGTP pyrophosphatase MutT (NUDIX family)